MIASSSAALHVEPVGSGGADGHDGKGHNRADARKSFVHIRPDGVSAFYDA
jgi:hypothetical protein